MTNMNCEACKEDLIGLISDSSQPSSIHRRQMVAEHLARCDECKAHASEILDGFALVALSLDPVEPSEGFHNRVMESIQSASSQEATVDAGDVQTGRSESVPLTSTQKTISYAIAAAILFTAVVGQWLYLKRIETAANAGRDPSAEERVTRLEQAVAEMQLLQNQAEKPEIRFVSFQPAAALPKAGDAPQVAAHAVWDSLSKQIHFFGFDMPTLGNNQTYAIWYLRGGTYQLVESFQVDVAGFARVVADIDDDPATDFPGQIVISVEQSQVGDSPSDQIWLQAAIK